MSETALKNRSRLLEKLLLYSPVLVAILIMLPRLLSPQFGLFDDGRSLVTAQTISSGTWYTGMDTIEGRFRPLHWLWFTSLYLIHGADPFWFFAGNALALAFVTGGLIFLVRKADGSRLQAWLAGVAFVLAGPIAETYFSLKAEAHQSIFLMLALLSMLPHAKAHTRLQTAGAFMLTTLVALCACYSKETSILLLPISIAWYLLARFWPGYEKDAIRQKMRGAFVVASLVAVLIFFVTRAWASSSQINAGTYTMRYALIFSQIVQSSIRWGGWMMRDFIWVVPLVVVFIILLLLRRRLMGGVLLFDAFIWMAAWVVIYLPWNFMAEYYMLPFAMGLAVFVSALIIEILPALREQGWKRWLSIAGLGLTLVLLIGSLVNTLTNARVQLTVDYVNAGMMAYLAQTAVPKSTVVVNFQDFTEYISEMQTQFESVYNRPDLTVIMFNPAEPLPESAGDIYLVTSKVQNQPLLTVRMGVIEESQDIWNKSLKGFMQGDPNWHSVFETISSFQLSDVNYPRLFCPFIETRAFCATPAPFFDVRPFVYGWTIYQLEKP